MVSGIKTPEATVQQIRAMAAAGINCRAIAKKLKIGRDQAQKYAKGYRPHETGQEPVQEVRSISVGDLTAREMRLINEAQVSSQHNHLDELDGMKPAAHAEARRPLPYPDNGNTKIAPEPDVWGRYISDKLKDTILVIPDLQAPYHHPDALPFLSMVSQRYQPELVVGIGDEVDFSFLSDHKKCPDIDNPIPELEAAISFMGELFKLFPSALALTSNHVHGRLSTARKNGRIPNSLMKNWREIVDAPKTWEWYEEIQLGNYLFRHGDRWPKLTGMMLLRHTPDKYGKHMNIVHGHIHSEHGIKAVERVGDDDYYGAYTGCLINPRAKAFDYTKPQNNKLGCIVIVKGVPHRIPLRLNDIGRWTGVL